MLVQVSCMRAKNVCICTNYELSAEGHLWTQFGLYEAMSLDINSLDNNLGCVRKVYICMMKEAI